MKSIFVAVLDLPDAERQAYIEHACGGDPELASEVASLLASDRSAGDFCETPAAVLLGSGAWGTSTPAIRLDPGTRLAGYEIVDFIGAGGMGEVYRARDVRLGRQVAIKTVPVDACAERAHDPASRRDAQKSAISRLTKEARHASRLQHPNICTVYEVGEANGIPFIAMEFVDGRTLSAVHREGKLPLHVVLDYAIQVADALQHAHTRGVVHRDLKSSNVVIAPDGRAIVLDFGLAKRLPRTGEGSDSITVSAPGPAGTLTHMPPEILSGGPGDARSDIWSFGVLLYQLANARLPFGGRTAFETSAAIMGEPPKAMERAVPLALRLVIERCLAKDPVERYQRVSEVRGALEAIRARRGWRIAGRLLMPGRRRFLQIAAAAVLALTTVVSGGRMLPRDPVAHAVGTLAVLPLENATGDATNDFYAAGLTDALISQLGAAGRIRVMSRASAERAAATGKAPAVIGRDLGADAVVQGSLRRSAGRIEVDLRLIGTGGEVLWSDSFDRGSRDVLVLQADVVRGVTQATRAVLRVGARERLTMVPAINPDVYEAYLRGRYEWNQRTPASLQRAIARFTEAITLDPAYAPAHAALADCYNQLGTVMVGGGSPREYRPRAEAEAVRALQIDPNSSEAHAALGYVRHYQLQWADAEQAFLRAIELNPSNALARLWYANLLMSRRRYDESLRQAYAARDLDPFSLVVNSNIGWILDYAGRHEEAVEQLTRTVALDPEYPQARFRLAGALAAAGRYDESLAQVRELLRLTKRSPSSVALLANVYASAGRLAEARRALDELLGMSTGQYVPPSAIGTVYGLLGEAGTALDYLERSVDEGSNWAAYMDTEGWTESLRSHPRFQALLRRAGYQ